MQRAEMLLSGLRLDGIGLEVGPGCSPLIAGSEHHDVRVLDYAPREELVRKFETYGEDTSRLPGVDYVWTGQRIGQPCFAPLHQRNDRITPRIR